jgi:hypothetical protein
VEAQQLQDLVGRIFKVAAQIGQSGRVISTGAVFLKT